MFTYSMTEPARCLTFLIFSSACYNSCYYGSPELFTASDFLYLWSSLKLYSILSVFNIIIIVPIFICSLYVITLLISLHVRREPVMHQVCYCVSCPGFPSTNCASSGVWCEHLCHTYCACAH